MVFETNLNKPASRVAVALSACVLCALLGLNLLSDFMTGTLADERVKVSRDVLASSVEQFPNSGRLHARLAEAELLVQERDLSRAEFHALRAISLSPEDYRLRLLLSSIKEAGGDRPAAEEALRSALALAPNNADVRWRLANLLLRQERPAESMSEFRASASIRDSLLPPTLDLIWRASGGNREAVEAVTGDDPKSKLTLAQFLLNQSLTDDAATVFKTIDRNSQGAQIDTSEVSAFLDALISAGRVDLAHGLWSYWTAGGNWQPSLVWNGGFESRIAKDLDQFDWLISRSDYARISLDTVTAHGGSKSLRIDFIGRAATRLEDEIKQLIVVRPGARYRLECYAKSDGLLTPEGPRVVVTSNKSTSWIAASDPVSAGSGDWRQLIVDFTAPLDGASGASGIYISVKRKPEFDHEKPTQGTVWFDDFVMKEQ